MKSTSQSTTSYISQRRMDAMKSLSSHPLVEDKQMESEGCLSLLSHSPLDLKFLTNSVRRVSHGAISCFLGTTRNFFQDKSVVELAYEAYESMALKEMHRRACEARKKWNVDVAVAHRLGVVPVGEESIAIFVSSEHRKQSLEAVAWLINEIKATVPIWKKEIYADGSCSWKENCECFFHPKHAST
ncbi:unnamed protein product [Cyprideis torosa]|uniref:Uncharacterized protein n=1 Tax=Cyprideis torosa TaxID=163714 RepID=A0A7R8ZKE0_9CRUS|nr:unnamed protein product [Cyprideis torosa]CAG0881543.1 unnamed protein product [Cyprideis torosa]